MLGALSMMGNLDSKGMIFHPHPLEIGSRWNNTLSHRLWNQPDARSSLHALPLLLPFFLRPQGRGRLQNGNVLWESLRGSSVTCMYPNKTKQHVLVLYLLGECVGRYWERNCEACRSDPRGCARRGRWFTYFVLFSLVLLSIVACRCDPCSYFLLEGGDHAGFVFLFVHTQKQIDVMSSCLLSFFRFAASLRSTVSWWSAMKSRLEWVICAGILWREGGVLLGWDDEESWTVSKNWLRTNWKDVRLRPCNQVYVNKCTFGFAKMLGSGSE